MYADMPLYVTASVHQFEVTMGPHATQSDIPTYEDGSYTLKSVEQKGALPELNVFLPGLPLYKTSMTEHSDAKATLGNSKSCTHFTLSG